MKTDDLKVMAKDVAERLRREVKGYPSNNPESVRDRWYLDLADKLDPPPKLMARTSGNGLQIRFGNTISMVCGSECSGPDFLDYEWQPVRIVSSNHHCHVKGIEGLHNAVLEQAAKFAATGEARVACKIASGIRAMKR